MDTAAIREHMEVVGDDGEHIGVVDAVENDMIKLTRSDPQAQGEHHWIPLAWVVGVDQVVRLSQSSHAAMEQWSTDSAAASGSEQAVGSGSGEDSYAANRERSAEGEVY
jgi:hypothetical protein